MSYNCLSKTEVVAAIDEKREKLTKAFDILRDCDFEMITFDTWSTVMTMLPASPPNNSVVRYPAFLLFVPLYLYDGGGYRFLCINVIGHDLNSGGARPIHQNISIRYLYLKQ